jgi:hypothetical protein
MKVSLLTTDGDKLTFEHVVGGRLELHLRDGNPEQPTAFTLDQLRALEVSGHPQPAVYEPPPPNIEAAFDVSSYAADGSRVGDQRIARHTVTPAQAEEWRGLRQPWPGVPGAPRLPAKPKKKAVK